MIILRRPRLMRDYEGECDSAVVGKDAYLTGEEIRVTGKDPYGIEKRAFGRINAGGRPYICERTALYVGAAARIRFHAVLTFLSSNNCIPKE